MKYQTIMTLATLILINSIASTFHEFSPKEIDQIEKNARRIFTFLVEDLDDTKAKHAIAQINEKYFNNTIQGETLWERLVNWYSIELVDFTENDQKELERFITSEIDKILGSSEDEVKERMKQLYP